MSSGRYEMSPKTPAGRRALRRVAAGVAIVAVPVAGMQLYLKAHAADAARAKALDRGVRYDTSGMKAVDPALIKYREVAKIDTGLSATRAISVDAKLNVIVVGDRAVRVLSPTGAVVRELKLEEPAFCAAVTAEGEAYVGLKDHVEVYGADGARRAVWPALGAGAYVTGITAAGEDVYVADSGRRVVVRADRAGRIKNEIGRADARRGLEGLVIPSPQLTVAVAEDGSVWLNDTGRNRLENYGADGTLNRFWGTAGGGVEAFPGCCNPVDFKQLAGGEFVTAEKGVLRVKRYSADGQFEAVVAAPSAFGADVTSLGVAADVGGRVYVLARGTRFVHVFEAIGGGR